MQNDNPPDRNEGSPVADPNEVWLPSEAAHDSAAAPGDVESAVAIQFAEIQEDYGREQGNLSPAQPCLRYGHRCGHTYGTGFGAD